MSERNELPIKLYYAIKHNQFPPEEDEKVSKEDLIEYENFIKTFEEFVYKLNHHDQYAFSILSKLMSFWGYNRRYCGMCGKPVIGKSEFIQERLVCKNCHSSYKITEELNKKYDETKNINEKSKTSVEIEKNIQK